MIVARYITKEVAWTFLAITAILLLIALSNRFAAFLAKAATGELPIGLVFRLVWLYIPELLSFLIPLSFFLAILFAYGRMHADSEMTVFAACGMSSVHISRFTLILSLLVMLIVGWLCLFLVPALAEHREKAVSEGEALAVIQSTLPGRFQMFGEGNLVFYLEDMDSKSNKLKGVFIAEKPEQEKNKGAWTLISAEEAHVEREAKTKDFYLVLKQGYRYQGKPGTGDYHIIKFAEYGRAVQQQMAPASSELLRTKQSSTLAESSALEDLAELQWRLSIPLSVPLLALLAIPLARVSPRHGRFAKFLPAILLYIVYYNLFTLSKRWIVSQVLPSFIGVWWVHLSFFALALGLWIKESGGWAQWKNRHLLRELKVWDTTGLDWNKNGLEIFGIKMFWNTKGQDKKGQDKK